MRWSAWPTPQTTARTTTRFPCTSRTTIFVPAETYPLSLMTAVVLRSSAYGNSADPPGFSSLTARPIVPTNGHASLDTTAAPAANPPAPATAPPGGGSRSRFRYGSFGRYFRNQIASSPDTANDTTTASN